MTELFTVLISVKAKNISKAPQILKKVNEREQGLLFLEGGLSNKTAQKIWLVSDRKSGKLCRAIFIGPFVVQSMVWGRRRIAALKRLQNVLLCYFFKFCWES